MTRAHLLMGVNRSFLTTLVLLICVEWGILHPFKTIGFYCNDPKLHFVNEGDTVSVSVLLLVSFVLPCFVFLIVERFLRSSNRKSAKDSVANSFWAKRARFWFFRYLHGLCFTFLVTDLAKLLVGEPRPHFFRTCIPQHGTSNCTSEQYFQVYNCTSGLSSKVLVDSYKSFPSGHASFSSYTASFFISYFAQTIRTDSHFLVNFLQVLCIGWALLCSLTRITDHRHHWWDVLAGSILGISVAAYFIRYRRPKRKSDLDGEKNNKNFQSHLINSNE